MQKHKKTLKQRVWSEIYQGFIIILTSQVFLSFFVYTSLGSKVFFMSGLSFHKYYPKNEIKRLGLHLNKVKFRPARIRNEFSFLVGDRWEIIQTKRNREEENEGREQEDEEDQGRDLVVYGYLRGVNLRDVPSQMVHLCGFGDVSISTIEKLKDPLPLQSRQLAEERTHLSNHLNKLYAPLSNSGSVMVVKQSSSSLSDESVVMGYGNDGDDWGEATYIDLGDESNVKYSSNLIDQEEGGENMNQSNDPFQDPTSSASQLKSLQSLETTIDENMKKDSMAIKLFKSSNEIFTPSQAEQFLHHDKEEEEIEIDEDEDSFYEEEEVDILESHKRRQIGLERYSNNNKMDHHPDSIMDLVYGDQFQDGNSINVDEGSEGDYSDLLKRSQTYLKVVEENESDSDESTTREEDFGFDLLNIKNRFFDSSSIQLSNMEDQHSEDSQQDEEDEEDLMVFVLKFVCFYFFVLTHYYQNLSQMIIKNVRISVP